MNSIVKRVEVLETRPVMRIVPTEPVPLDSPADVLALLAEQVNEVRADAYAGPVEKARTPGFLASLALRAMKSRDLTARLEAVDRVLRLRRDDQKRVAEDAKWWKKR
jgi:hypothetical protein